MFNPKKATNPHIHGNGAAYSGTVTAVTHMTIVVFIPALDVEVDVKRNPDASIQNGSAPKYEILLLCRLCSKTATMLSPQPHSCLSRTSGRTLPSPMTTFFCLMTTRRQRNTTGTTNLP